MEQNILVIILCFTYPMIVKLRYVLQAVFQNLINFSNLAAIVLNPMISFHIWPKRRPILLNYLEPFWIKNFWCSNSLEEKKYFWKSHFHFTKSHVDLLLFLFLKKLTASRAEQLKWELTQPLCYAKRPRKKVQFHSWKKAISL